MQSLLEERSGGAEDGISDYIIKSKHGAGRVCRGWPTGTDDGRLMGGGDQDDKGNQYLGSSIPGK